MTTWQAVTVQDSNLQMGLPSSWTELTETCTIEVTVVLPPSDSKLTQLGFVFSQIFASWWIWMGIFGVEIGIINMVYHRRHTPTHPPTHTPKSCDFFPKILGFFFRKFLFVFSDFVKFLSFFSRIFPPLIFFCFVPNFCSFFPPFFRFLVSFLFPFFCFLVKKKSDTFVIRSTKYSDKRDKSSDNSSFWHAIV